MEHKLQKWFSWLKNLEHEFEKQTSRHLLSQSYHLLTLHKHVIIDDMKPGIMSETLRPRKIPGGTTM